MNICFNGFKTGEFCLGDATARLHGPEYGMTHAGLLMLALLAVVMAVYVFRDPV